MTFEKWIDTLVKEKGYDTECIFEVEGPTGDVNMIPLKVVITALKSTGVDEQAAIKSNLVNLDFRAANLLDYFRHLSGALAL